MLVKYCVRGTVALGMVGALVWCETHGESQEHAQYTAVAPNASVNIGGSGGFFSNVSTATVTYHAPPVNLEQLVPHERLVIQASALTPLNAWTVAVAATGQDPFFQRRPRPARLTVATPKLPPFWCASFQKFHVRQA